MSAVKKSIKINIEDSGDEAETKPAAKAKPARKKAAAPRKRKTAVKKPAAVKEAAKTESISPPAAPEKAVEPNKTVKISVSDEDSGADKRKKAAPAAPVKTGSDSAPAPEITAGEAERTKIAAQAIESGLKKKAGTKSISLEDRLAQSQAVRAVIKESEKGKLATPAEIREPEAPAETVVRPRRRIKVYRNIAISFILLTVVLVSVLAYFSLVKVTITLIPNQERVSNNMIFEVYDKDKNDSLSAGAIWGIVRTADVTATNTFESTGKEVIGQEAVGEVTLYNSYTKNQPLVATTRLLSADGKLFRLKNTVNIPVGGSVKAEIYADEPSPEMAIGPTKFTIPGLWAGLQDKIYAESKTAVVYQEKVKKHITSDDLEASKRDLKQKLLANAKSEINDTYSDYSQVIYKVEDTSIKSTIDGRADEEADSFDGQVSGKVVVIAFDNNDSAALAQTKFIASLPDNKEMLDFDKENIIYALNNADYVGGQATVNATFEGRVTLKNDSGVVEIDKILGLNNSQLETYLKSLPEIAGFQVDYSPSFIKRVPKLVDRVKIIIKK